MKLIPINKGKRRKTRYNSCRTENKTLTHRKKIKLRIKETIFLFIRNKHTHTNKTHTTLSQQAENENKNTNTQQIKLYKTNNKQTKKLALHSNTQKTDTHTHFQTPTKEETSRKQNKKNNCQNKIRTIVFNKNDNKPVFLSQTVTSPLRLLSLFLILSLSSLTFCRSLPRFAPPPCFAALT